MRCDAILESISDEDCGCGRDVPTRPRISRRICKRTKDLASEFDCGVSSKRTVSQKGLIDGWMNGPMDRSR